MGEKLKDTYITMGNTHNNGRHKQEWETYTSMGDKN
jgi:hypothetical protein